MISAEGDSGLCVLVLTDGASAPVSGTDEGRFRLNTTLHRLEYSENGGPWTPFATGGGGNDSSVLACPAGVGLNEAVAITSADTVDQADASNASARPAVGIVVSKPTSTSCIVRYAGELTGFVGLTPGATYYLDTSPGAITSTPPSNPGDIRQVVGTALDSTTLIVDIERDVVLLAP